MYNEKKILVCAAVADNSCIVIYESGSYWQGNTIESCLKYIEEYQNHVSLSQILVGKGVWGAISNCLKKEKARIKIKAIVELLDGNPYDGDLTKKLRLIYDMVEEYKGF